MHEAYLRLVESPLNAGMKQSAWDGKGHFFAAAAEAMRRILVEAARRKKRLKRGGDLARQNLLLDEVAEIEPREDLLALDEALHKLAATDRTAADLVQLRYFTGLTIAEAAQALNIPPRTADRRWAYARAWLHRELMGSDPEGK